MTGWYSWPATATWPSAAARPRRGATSACRISPRCTSGSPVSTPRRSGRSDSRRASARRKPQRGDGFTAHPGHPFAGQAHGRGPAMVASDAAQCRCPVPQPADPGDPARLTGAGHGDDGDAVQARCVRPRQRGRRRPGPDRVLDRVRRLLLRPDVRPAPDRRGDGRYSGGSGWPGSASGPTWHPRSPPCFRCWPE